MKQGYIRANGWTYFSPKLFKKQEKITRAWQALLILLFTLALLVVGGQTYPY